MIANDVQYRLALTQYGALFKFFDGGKVTSPTGVKTTVTRLGTNGLRFAFAAGRLGWNGTTPILYQESTQSGVPGTPNEGFPDETAIKTGYP